MVRTGTVVKPGSVVKWVVACAALGAMVLAAPPLWLAIDESAVPPSSTYPALPDGARLVSVDMGCGSGGCWRELIVAAPDGMTGAALAAEMVPDGGECVARSLVDLRRVCTSIAETAGPDVSESDVVRFYVQYDRS